MAQTLEKTTISEKPLAEPPPAEQDIPAQQAVNREEPDVRPQTRRTPQTFKPKIEPRPEYKPFADALRAAMTRAGIKASEVARRMWSTTTDRRGYTVARNRDRIGHYLNGTSYPGPDNLRRLADAVGVSVEDLALVSQTHRTIARGPSPDLRDQYRTPAAGLLNIIDLSGGTAQLQVNRELPWELAMKIYQMIKTANGNLRNEDAPQPGDVISSRQT